MDQVYYILTIPYETGRWDQRLHLELVSAESQALPKICWIRTCRFNKTPGDLCVYWSLRSAGLQVLCSIWYFSSQEAEAQEKKFLLQVTGRWGAVTGKPHSPHAQRRLVPTPSSAPAPPATPPPSYETLFSIPLPQRWMEDGPALWPLRAAHSQGHKAPLQEKGAGGCMPPRMLSGSAQCVEKDVGTTAGTFPTPEACLSSPHVDFPCRNLRSLWPQNVLGLKYQGTDASEDSPSWMNWWVNTLASSPVGDKDHFGVTPCSLLEDLGKGAPIALQQHPSQEHTLSWLPPFPYLTSQHPFLGFLGSPPKSAPCPWILSESASEAIQLDWDEKPKDGHHTAL